MSVCDSHASWHPVVKTPNLDQLAADGALFTHNFANALPCAPSRASIHTGTYQLTHRVLINGKRSLLLVQLG